MREFYYRPRKWWWCCYCWALLWASLLEEDAQIRKYSEIMQVPSRGWINANVTGIGSCKLLNGHGGLSIMQKSYSSAQGGVTHSAAALVLHGNPIVLNCLASSFSTATMYLMLLQSVAFVSAWTAIHFRVAKHGPIKGARTFVRLNSWFYATVSAAMLVLICSSDHDLLARQVYHVSKFYEYVDVLGVRASGGSIELHFAIHHLTTPYLTYMRVLHHSEGWQLIAALNAFHHILMYAYFGGVTMLRPILAITGSVQLAVGVVGESWILNRNMRQEHSPIWPHVCTLGLLCTYSVLWARELRQKGMSSEKEKQT